MSIYKTTITIEIYRILTVTYYVDAPDRDKAMLAAQKQAIEEWEYEIIWNFVDTDCNDDVAHYLRYLDEDDFNIETVEMKKGMKIIEYNDDNFNQNQE